MSDRRQLRLRLSGVILGAAAAAIVIVGTWQFWWQGWSPVATWLKTWWWLPMAALVSAAGWGLIRASRSATALANNSEGVGWETVPGQRGVLVARMAEMATPTPLSSHSSSEVAVHRSILPKIAMAVVPLLVAAFAFVPSMQQVSAMREQVKIAQDGQIVARLDSAVNQISAKGVDNLQARLGGIRAMERLAGDSPRDRPAIVGHLSAFIRDNLPKARPVLGVGGKEPCPPPFGWQPLRSDVQEALTVLSRQNRAKGNNDLLDLKGVSLAGADLTGAKLEGFDLTKVDFEGASLVNADLSGALLSSTSFACAYLQDASLVHSRVYSSDFSDAHLEGVNFNGVQLGMSHFDGAHLRNALHDQETEFAMVSDIDVQDAWWRPGQYGGGGV
ncbi:pentapeptide repeat-containing protein [Amycolatopsis sp. cmx-4-83]|uniref:pentapeptide repeat-containing protein n=1 Tax=Amycolatopsis sp. cmx-4-83 TaxID=2790940 RepID=UPI00397AC0F0